MGDLIQVPFASYHNLNKWFIGASTGEVCEQYYHGMKNWLRKSNPVISIFDYGEGTGKDQMLDIQMEFEIDGERDQVFLLSLVTSLEVDDNGLYMNDVPTPFYAGPVIWPRENLTRSDILDAVRSWSLKWWPDFKVTYQFARVIGEDSAELEDDMFTYHLNVVVNRSREHEEDIIRWAKKQGCMAVERQKNRIILIGLPVSALSSLDEKWPGALDYYDPMIP